ncbi:DUF6009 family protein [Kitasatospora sp. NPDC002965]|uniref:DUF6009 family protein n=1 Tax=Kitasatospora sp. NPDC002965 TaxID=3154775 RepID=UPI0033ACCD8A
MSSLINAEALTAEVRLRWLEDWDLLDYVRQAVTKDRRRAGQPRYGRAGRLVGWADLGEDADRDPDTGLYRRRIFYLLPHDRDQEPDGQYRVGAPGEAIDPRTLAPCAVGEKTDRSQQRALLAHAEPA